MHASNPREGPIKVSVMSSGKDKLDGVYTRMPQAFNHKSCFVMKGGKAPMYLYWMQTWKVGTELGSSKSFASVADEPGRMHPCEPYPHRWKVFDSKLHKYVKVPGMRVSDHVAKKDSSKAKKRITTEQPSTPEKRARFDAPASPLKTTAPKAGGRKDKLARKPSMKENKIQRKASNDNASDSSSDSDSSTDSSSSSSSSVTQLVAPPTHLKPQCTKNAAQSSQKQLDQLVAEVRMRLSKISDFGEQQKKLKFILEKLQKKADNQDGAGGTSPEMARNLVNVLKEDFINVPNPSQRQWFSGAMSPPAADDEPFFFPSIAKSWATIA